MTVDAGEVFSDAPPNGKASAQQSPEPSFHSTDSGNAQRLEFRHGANLRYVSLWDKCFVWDGMRWKRDDTREVERLALETVLQIYNDVGKQKDKDDRKALFEHARRSESDSKIKATISRAKSLRSIAALPEDFDQNPMLFNCLNGTVELDTGLLRPARREDMITKLCPISYQAEATCPIWDAFLERIMAGNKEKISYLQKAAGYSATGNTQEQCFFVLFGTGNNGKTTFLEKIRTSLGDYYAGQIPMSSLIVKKTDSGLNNDIASLKGKRFVTAIESGKGKRLDEEKVKTLSGGDTVTARFMYSEFFDFKPQFKIWLATNHKPVIRGTDLGIWRRVRLIPFTVPIPEHEQDETLGDKLDEELPGILNWIIQFEKVRRCFSSALRWIDG
jgi:putative DNA primase/helicase